MIKKIFLIFLVSLGLITEAQAQLGPSNNGPFYGPNWYQGYVPPSSQWQLLWTNKMDYFPSGLPIQYGGCGATTVVGCLSNLGVASLVLNSGQMFVGNSFNATSAVTPTGDWSVTNSGATLVTTLPHVTDSSLANSGLVHPSLTVNGVNIALGASGTITAVPSGIVPTTLGGSGINNAGTLTWGSGGTLPSGSAAYQSIGTSGTTVPLLSTINSWGGQQTFIAPVLGTPASAILSNATGLPLSTGITGTLPTANTATGKSVIDPGTGVLESVLPIQTITGTSNGFTGTDFFKKTRRSNSGTAMTDTLPASSTTGLVNGTRINIVNADATASDTVTAGSGTTISGNSTFVIAAGRDLMWVYDLANTAWRADANTSTTALTNGTNTFTLLQSLATVKQPPVTGTITSNILTIDCNLGNFYNVASNANITTLTMQNCQAGSGVLVYFTGNGTSFTQGGFSSFRWPNGLAPALTATNGQVDVIYFATPDAVNDFGFVISQNM